MYSKIDDIFCDNSLKPKRIVVYNYYFGGSLFSKRIVFVKNH